MVVEKVITGAHYGLKDWLVQRISAIVMAVYLIFLAGYVLANFPLQYSQWQGLFSLSWMRYFSLLFFLALYWHAWIGVRNILMDYVRPNLLRLGMETAVIIALMLYLMWSIHILWSL